MTRGKRDLPHPEFTCELGWFEVALIDVPSYQRAEIPTYVKELNTQWTSAAFGALALALTEGGRANVIDGHQRLAVCRLRGIDPVPSVIHPRMSLDFQAQVFRMMDHRRALKQIDKYKAGLICEDPGTTAVEKITRSRRCAITGSEAPKGMIPLTAIAAVFAIFNQGDEGDRRLDTCLDVLTQWLPDGPIYGDMLTGMAMLLRRRKDIGIPALIGALQQVQLQTVKQMVTEHRARVRGGPTGGGHDAGSWEAIFERIYNDGGVGTELVQVLNGRVAERLEPALP